jgi:hypothetical protein
MAADISDRIQRLISQREDLAATLADIDEKLGEITSILGIVKPGRKPGFRPALAPAPIAEVPIVLPKKGKRQRRKFAVTGLDSILAFVKARKKPTTKEVNANWKSEGRGGTADSLLGQLVKNGILKRKQLGGKLGSQYSMA